MGGHRLVALTVGLAALAHLVPGAGSHGTFQYATPRYEVWWGEPGHVYVHLEAATFEALKRPGDGWLLARELGEEVARELARERSVRGLGPGEWYCDGSPAYVQPVPCEHRAAFEIEAHVQAGDPDVHFDRAFGYEGFLPGD